MWRRIGIIGGGPGGLYLARLVRRAAPKSEVVVFERNHGDSTFGFGVAFSPATLSNLAAADPETHEAIIAASVGWDGMTLRLGDREVRWPGFGLHAISRTVLLSILQTAARDAGARLEFESEVSVEDLEGFDVIVAADGANSRTRTSLGDSFGPSIGHGLAKYMWLGSTGPFEHITFCIRRHAGGTFAIHAYPHAAGAATLVIETDEQSWRRAGFAEYAEHCVAPGVSDERSARVLAGIFAEDLQGHRLLLNNSKWLNFPTVRNRNWSSGNVVLLGDAAHTAHPSVASGTKLAMEDGIALAEELLRASDLNACLRRYELRRRPEVEHVQRRAALSRRWWETLRWRSGMTPEQLAISYLTRSGAIGYDKLLQTVPDLTGSPSARGLRQPEGPPSHAPLLTPLRIAGHRLPTRLIGGTRRPKDGAPVSTVRTTGTPNDLIRAVRQERTREPGALIAAELPPPVLDAAADGALDALQLAADLRASGCDIVALSVSASEHWAEVAERIRLELGIPTLVRLTSAELDRAATEVLAGRIDLVEVLDQAPAATVEDGGALRAAAR
jgi:anthraniloyl-CoA monooxygenase